MNARKAALRVASICLKVAIFVVIILGIIYLGQNAYHYTHEIFNDEPLEAAPGKDVTVKITQDVSTKQLAKVLEDNGLIDNAVVFQIKMKIADFDDTVKAGDYKLNTSMPPSEMFKILSGQNEDDDT